MDDPFFVGSAVTLGLFMAYVFVRVHEYVDMRRRRKEALEREVHAMWTAHMWRIAQVWRSQLSEYDLLRLHTDRRIIEEQMKGYEDGPLQP